MIFNKLIKIVANIAKYKVTQWSVNPIKTQQKQFNFLMKIGSKTLFGREHNLFQGITYNEFKNRVPIRDYEQIKHYIERVKNGGKYFMERKTNLFCNDIWHYIRIEIYPYYKT